MFRLDSFNFRISPQRGENYLLQITRRVFATSLYLNQRQGDALADIFQENVSFSAPR